MTDSAEELVTLNLEVRLVVPIPTLPLESTRILSALSVLNTMVPLEPVSVTSTLESPAEIDAPPPAVAHDSVPEPFVAST
jgi:hypothetical protein